MSTQKIKALYAELQQTQQQFIHFSQTVSALQLQLSQRRVALNGEWTGQSWSSFMNEMDLDIIPALGRLSRAMGSVEQFLADASLQLEEVEKEGAASIAQLNQAQSPRPDGRDAIGDFPDGSSVEDHKLPPDGMSNHNIMTAEEYAEFMIESWSGDGPPPKIILVNGINDNTPEGIGGFTQKMYENLIAAGYPADELVATNQIFSPWQSTLFLDYGIDLKGTNNLSNGITSDFGLFTDLSTNFAAGLTNLTVNSSLKATDTALNNWFNSDIGKMIAGAIDVSHEYQDGIEGQYSSFLFKDISYKLNQDPLLPGQSVILIGHSGGGAPIANITPYLENELGIDVSGLVTMGSPLSNFDAAQPYAETIIQIRNEDDFVGFPYIRPDIRLETLREENIKIFDVINGTAPAIYRPGGIISSPMFDILLRHVGAETVITHNGSESGLFPSLQNILNGHGSYPNPDNTEVRQSLNDYFDLDLETNDLSDQIKD